MIELVWENGQTKVAWLDEFAAVAKSCAEKTLELEAFPYDAEVNLFFVDNDEIRAVNREQRGKDQATDVLSFPMLEQEEDGSLIVYDEDFLEDRVLLGDIVLSLERAWEQAAEYGHSLRREVGFLVAHSMLHLLGYDHEKGEREEKEMFEKQETILNELGITRSGRAK